MDRSTRRKLQRIRRKLAQFRRKTPLWRSFSRKKTSIYVLIDPTTSKIRYVGRSDDPKKRYRSHIREAKKFQKYISIKLTSNPRTKNEWICWLLQYGMRPLLLVVDTVPERLGQETEEYWIQTIKSLNYKLFNKIRAQRR